jgi:thiamine-phosphate pyrophosphorylase
MAINDILQEAILLNSHHNNKNLPPLIFLTERNRFENIFTTLNSIPEQTLVIIRDYDLGYSERLEYCKKIVEICKARGIKILIGKDPDLAQQVNADGIHIPEKLLPNLKQWKRKKSNWLFTTSCHSKSSLKNIDLDIVDAILLSPVFPTKSHPDAEVLGPDRFKNIAASSKISIYALGGINKNNVKNFQGTKVVGFAGIEMFKLKPN